MADLFHRVSIRKFKDEAVSNEDIGYILEAAMAAPSAKNQQPWEFYVVENREVLKRLGESSPFSAPAGKALAAGDHTGGISGTAFRPAGRYAPGRVAAGYLHGPAAADGPGAGLRRIR